MHKMQGLPPRSSKKAQRLSDAYQSYGQSGIVQIQGMAASPKAEHKVILI